MEYGEVIFYLVVSIFSIHLILKFGKFLFLPNKAEKEYNRRLEESLKDEYIIDPETGAKLTLEQAESGHWIKHDNEFLPKPEIEIEKLLTEEERNAERAINYLKVSKEYLNAKLSNEEIETLTNSKTLSKYDDWSYSDCFEIQFLNGKIFFPAVKIIDKIPSYYSNDYHESQIMFWIKFDYDFGHYYLREKLNVEKVFDFIRNDDELKLKNYECFTFRKSENIIKLNLILKHFEEEKGLEIEFFDKNIFIKNQKLINLEDIQRIELIVRKFN